MKKLLCSLFLVAGFLIVVAAPNNGRNATFWPHCIREPRIAVAGPPSRPLERHWFVNC